MVVTTFRQFGARQTEAGAMRNALAHQGIAAPHTGEPYTEALLFGLGGGVGFGYFTFEMGHHVTLYINTRIMTQENAKPLFHLTICDRIAVGCQHIHTPKRDVAIKKLDKALEDGRAPIVWAHRSALPYYAGQQMDHTYHNIVLGGFDEAAGTYLVADRAEKPLSLTRDTLWSSATCKESPKLRALVLDDHAGDADLKKSVTEAIRDGRRQMLEGWDVGKTKSNTGVNGLLKWADLLTDRKDKKGWPTMFPDSAALYGRLGSIFHQIETRGEAGAFRGLYADFLDEAAGILGEKNLSKSAERFREAADMWSVAANSFLPDKVGPFQQMRKLLLKKDRLFLKKGEAAMPEMREVNDELASVQAEAAENPPLSQEETIVMLGKAGEALRSVAEHERAAFEGLEV